MTTRRGSWRITKDGDPVGLALYLRHYSARKRSPGARLPLFVGPGEKLVLLSRRGDALLAWRRMLYSQDGQSGVCCAVFRNEGKRRSSALIREAMGLAWSRWPGERLYTYVDSTRIRSVNPGCCFKIAGWKSCGKSKRGCAHRCISWYPARRSWQGSAHRSACPWRAREK